MQTYHREVAERIIQSRQDPNGNHEHDDFIINDDGVFPVKGIASIGNEFQARVWRPACELSAQAKPSWSQPSLPIPFNANELAAFFLHGNGWYIRDSFGAWEDGPDDAVFEGMIQPGDDIATLVVPEVKRAVTEAFDAYRAAECVVGAYDKTYATTIQQLEKRYGLRPDALEARQSIEHAHADAEAYDAGWRKQMVNRLLAAPVNAPIETKGTPDDAEPAAGGPRPLTTGDIAFSFDGLHWTVEKWKKPLGDKPKWLRACIVIPGARGTSETRWNPVLIGAALVQQGHANIRSVRAKFQTVPLLKPWLDAWKTYEADNFDSN